jgi:hypothetical protein
MARELLIMKESDIMASSRASPPPSGKPLKPRSQLRRIKIHGCQGRKISAVTPVSACCAASTSSPMR